MPTQSKRVMILVGGMFALLVLFFTPLLLLPVIAPGLLGLAIARSAALQRQEGWVSGVMMGIILMLITFGTILVFAFHNVVFAD